MPLPANDVFSLGLAHDQPRRSSSRTRTPSIPRRSSSPKISFPSPSQPSTPTPSSAPFSAPLGSASGVNGMGTKRGHKRKAPSRQDSQHSITLSGATIEELVEEVDAQIAARERKETSSKKHQHVRNGSASSSPNGLIDKRHDRAVKKPIDWEIPRKTLHSSIGFFTIYLYTSHGSPQHVIIALSSALAVLIPIDVLRLRYPLFERAFEKCVGIFMRDSEKKSSNGVIWYILGVNTVLVALPLDIAVVSILILSWADTAASTFGRLYGSLTPRLPTHILGLPLAPRKSLAGFIAASLTGAAVATSFWTLIGPMRSAGLTWSWSSGVSPSFSGVSAGSEAFAGWVGIVTIGIVAGLVSGVAEALDLGSVDDNLSLPIIAGGCLWSLFKVLGWLGGVLA
ncbi:hypothetical protein HYDPIDRAFT_43702 [Hydnomerulius pinastri MD-312]|uniref:Phosphatidate cytidylyltransferase n=1 Tax=Hydnomerulius pinastri MD-312 TaxID=994086 RepID=A0A0C9VQ67_9AGAM|nr:hypothetical protein HYDPIDRAFT_43702 [Hydnomerulius pinastri MD-312]